MIWSTLIYTVYKKANLWLQKTKKLLFNPHICTFVYTIDKKVHSRENSYVHLYYTSLHVHIFPGTPSWSREWHLNHFPGTAVGLYHEVASREPAGPSWKLRQPSKPNTAHLAVAQDDSISSRQWFQVLQQVNNIRFRRIHITTKFYLTTTS
jgi:hypothetical protein